MVLTFPCHAVFRGQLSDEVNHLNEFADGYTVQLMPRRYRNCHTVSITDGSVTGVPADVAASMMSHFAKRLNIAAGLIGVL